MSEDKQSANEPIEPVEEPDIPEPVVDAENQVGDTSSANDWDNEDWDEDDWDDEPPRSGGGGIPLWVGIAGVIAILLLIAALISARGSNDDNTVVAGGSAPSGSAEGAAKECADWPGLGGLGAPEIVTQPGIHMWSDLKGWHLSRVPGEDVPGLIATVQTDGSEDDLPSEKAVVGGAKVEPSGNQLKVSLPAGDAGSQADFEIGSYVTTVTITMTDPEGVLLEPATFTTGSGRQPSTNPIVGSRTMKVCGS